MADVGVGGIACGWAWGFEDEVVALLLLFGCALEYCGCCEDAECFW